MDTMVVERDMSVAVDALAEKKTTWGSVSALVTGADGFLGTALCRRLIDYGVRTSALIHDVDLNQRFYGDVGDIRADSVAGGMDKTYLVDIRDYESVHRAVVMSQADVIFHLAAITQVKDAEVMPRITYQTNVMGTLHVLEAAAQSPRHNGMGLPFVLVASSDKAYGEPLDEPLVETTRLNPRHPYDASKAAADMIAKSYGAFYDLPVAITRCANIYGPGDTNWQRLIPGVIRDYLRGRPPVIRSDGTPVREYIYVEDVVDAYLSIVEHHSINGWDADGVVFNLSARDSLDVLAVVTLIQLLMGMEEVDPIIEATSDTETDRITINDEKIRSWIGWSPQIEFQDGVFETIDWLSRYLGCHEWRKNWYEMRTVIE